MAIPQITPADVGLIRGGGPQLTGDDVDTINGF
jgi:hypothetical protein